MIQDKNNYNINILLQDNNIQYQADESPSKNPLIKQKISFLSKSVYQSLPDEEKKSIKQIQFTVVNSDTLQIKIKKEEGEIDFNTNLFEDADQLRSIELIRTINQLGVETLHSENAESTHPSLPLPENVKIQLPKSNFFVTVFRTIHSWYINRYTLQPAIKEFTHSYFQYVKDLKDAEALWIASEFKIQSFVDKQFLHINAGFQNPLINRDEILNEVEKQLQTKYQTIYRHYTGKEISLAAMHALKNEKKVTNCAQLFQNLADSKLELMTEIGFDSRHQILEDIQNIKKEISVLHEMKPDYELMLKNAKEANKEKAENDLRDVERLIIEHEELLELSNKALNDFDQFAIKLTGELHIAQAEWTKMVDAMDILDIPLEKIAYTPLNVYTEESLISTWKRIFKELKEQGNLNELGQKDDIDPALLIKQIRLADTYLVAAQLVPNEIKDLLLSEINAVDLEKLKSILWSQPNTLELKSRPISNDLEKRQLTFQTFIQPLLEEEINVLTKVNKDFIEIANELKDRQSPLLQQWADKAIKRLEINGITLKEQEQLVLTKDSLIDQLIASLEELGVNSFYITGDQILHLKEMRNHAAQQKAIGIAGKGVVKIFKEKTGDFKTQMDALAQSLKHEKNQRIPLDMQIPELDVPLLELELDQFESYVDQQEKQLETLQKEIAALKSKNGNKAIIPQNKLKNVAQLKDSIALLKKAAKSWDSRYKLIDNQIIRLKASNRSLLSLTENEIALIQKNISDARLKIEQLDKEDVSNVKILRDEELRIKKLEQALSNPGKAEERKERMNGIKQEIEILKGQFSQFAKDQIAQIEISLPFISALKKLEVNTTNEPIMLEIWQSVLQKLQYQLINGHNPEKTRLQLSIALKTLMALQAPAPFKNSMAIFTELMEIQGSLTEELLDLFSNLEGFNDVYNELIENAQRKIPAGKVIVPGYNAFWNELSPAQLKEVLLAKQTELKNSNDAIDKKQKILSETSLNIKNYETLKNPAIKKKGGMQILVKEEDKLAKELINLQYLNKEIKNSIHRIKELQKGNSVELKPKDCAQIKPHQTGIERITPEEWQQLEKMRNESSSNDLVNSLFESRKLILEQKTKIERLELDKEEQIVQLKAKIEEKLQEIDSGSIQAYRLIELEITPLNEELVTQMWSGFLNEIDAAKFEHLKDRSAQALEALDKDASSYLRVRNALACTSIQELQDLLKGSDENEKVFSYLADRRKMAIEAIKSFNPTGAEALLGTIVVPPMPLEKPGKDSKEAQAFNSYEIENLKLLTKAIEQAKANKGLSEDEKEKVNAFVAFAKKNNASSKDFNAKLSLLQDRKPLDMKATIKEMAFGIIPENKRLFEKIPYGISEEAVQIAMTLSYNFKTPEIFSPLVQKFDNLLHKIKEDEEISLADQLTLRELGMLQKCAKMNHVESKDEIGILKHLEPLGIMERTPSFKELQVLSDKAQLLLNQAQEIFNQQSDYRDGDIVANLGRKKLEMAGRKPNSEEEVHFSLITPYCHGAKLYKNEGKTMVSHVVGTYIQEELKMLDDAYSEVWRLDTSALIPSQHHALMQEKYGAEWKKELQEKFQAIENHIQQNKKEQFSDLKNPWERRIDAGKADYIWGGHVAKTDRDFEKMADKMLGEREDKEHMTIMICSEFSSKTTLAALVKLNRDLTQELGDFLIQQGDVDQGNKLKAEKNVLDLPFDRKERLKLIHPGRMIDLLVKRKCVKKLEQPKILSQILRPEIAAK
ncbi:MAG: hypothetical protein H0V82_11445 [Candidatus Protochlamydia sp.]|nr:hypothetical protein [Candidatus Protochlamydia sp.]